MFGKKVNLNPKEGPMQRVDRCVACDGDVIWMEFKKTQCCSWCGLHYSNDGKPNPSESVEMLKDSKKKVEPK